MLALTSQDTVFKSLKPCCGYMLYAYVFVMTWVSCVFYYLARLKIGLIIGVCDVR